MTVKVQVLWLIEHVAREMDVACAVKCIAEASFQTDISIRHLYLHANESMRKLSPSVVVVPFFYSSSNLALKEYLTVWPRATFFNLAWEEIFYDGHKKSKSPADEFTRQRVIHHAWGEFYKDFLVQNGVSQNNIFVNGHPAYRLYLPPYNRYYKTKDFLASKYCLDQAIPWIFIPENYGWAFASEEKITQTIAAGAKSDDLAYMKKFCKDSLSQLLIWCAELAEKRRVEIIFRPRPATDSNSMQAFFNSCVRAKPKNLHFIKGGSVREWIIASDTVISSYSTSLIEAAIASKSIYMIEPIPIPQSLYCRWYKYVSRIHNFLDFSVACFTPDTNNYAPLRSWANTEMLSNGDPIQGLAKFISELTTRRRDSPSNGISKTIASISQRSKCTNLKIKFTLELAKNSLLSNFRSRKHLNSARYVQNAIKMNSMLTRINSSLFQLFQNLFKIWTGFKKLHRFLKLLLLSDRAYFNPITHENDLFSPDDVQSNLKHWESVLMGHALNFNTTQPVVQSSKFPKLNKNDSSQKSIPSVPM